MANSGASAFSANTQSNLDIASAFFGAVEHAIFSSCENVLSNRMLFELNRAEVTPQQISVKTNLPPDVVRHFLKSVGEIMDKATEFCVATPDSAEAHARLVSKLQAKLSRTYTDECVR